MSINRLRQILQSQLQVTLDSSPATVARIQQKVDQRRADLAAKGKPPISSKNPVPVNSIQNIASIVLRPIDLLRKIGALTIPSSINMAQYSASWATRRYFWAIQPGNGPFRLSVDARQLDFHQKTLLSDEFGIGMAGLIMERLFEAPQFSDISAALKDPALGVEHLGGPQPDYLMWGSGPAAPFYVVECKGCQTSRHTSYDQLRRAMEQLPTIRIVNGTRQVLSLVIATILESYSTTVIVIDPPDEDGKMVERKFRGESVSERVGQREWRIPNEEALRNRSLDVFRSQMLKWSGQVRAAAEIDETLEEQRLLPAAFANLTPELRNVGNEGFVGFRTSLFPELGMPNLQVFQGVEQGIFKALFAGREDTRATLTDFDRRLSHGINADENPFASIGRDGSCFLVEGL